MRKQPTWRYLARLRAGAIATLTTLACAGSPGGGGTPPTSSVSAVSPPHATPVVAGSPAPVLQLQFDPIGALRGNTYRGALRSVTGSAVFDGAISVRLRAQHTSSILGLRITGRTRFELCVEFWVMEDAADTEVFIAAIGEGNRHQEISVLLRTADAPWDAAWKTLAIAPPDTAMADSTGDVVLGEDAFRYVSTDTMRVLACSSEH